MMIRVKNAIGDMDEPIKVDVAPEDTVGLLIQKAAGGMSIPAAGAVAMFGGRELLPEQNLKEVGLKDGDLVMIAPGAVEAGDM